MPPLAARFTAGVGDEGGIVHGESGGEAEGGWTQANDAAGQDDDRWTSGRATDRPGNGLNVSYGQ